MERIISNRDYYKANLTSSGQIENNFNEIVMESEIREEPMLNPVKPMKEAIHEGPKG